MALDFDPFFMLRVVDARLPTITNPRHRAALKNVREHMAGEITGDFPRVMATLIPEPKYNFWGSPRIKTNGTGPTGRAEVLEFYTSLLNAGATRLEHRLEYLVVDDQCIVTDGPFSMIAPGAYWGIKDDPEGLYRQHTRLLNIWPYRDDGLIIGEDGYSRAVPDAPVKLTDEEARELPSVTDYRAQLARQEATEAA